MAIVKKIIAKSEELTTTKTLFKVEKENSHGSHGGVISIRDDGAIEVSYKKGVEGRRVLNVIFALLEAEFLLKEILIVYQGNDDGDGQEYPLNRQRLVDLY
jgi:hypothetical protein